MQSVAFVIPLLPGKTETAREALKSCRHGDRRSAYESSRERLGITGESVWYQQTPIGDVAVIHMEAHDLASALKGMAASEEPFDRWFRENARDVHGIALEDGFPPPEQVLDYRS